MQLCYTEGFEILRTLSLLNISGKQANMAHNDEEPKLQR